MLTGQMSGVTITQESGNPGQDAGTIRIRGVGSFGATPSPLVLVDGLPGSLSDLTPADIDNISVLKDASSAAIYGSRAANGVILVTTKKGKEGKARIIYNGSVGMSQATELPELAHSYEYAEFYNKAIGAETYTPEMIQKYRDGSDPDNYADEMYLDDLLGGHALVGVATAGLGPHGHQHDGFVMGTEVGHRSPWLSLAVSSCALGRPLPPRLARACLKAWSWDQGRASVPESSVSLGNDSLDPASSLPRPFNMSNKMMQLC
jgi:TonB-dependent SusC/RagA subfamily outer membrane receptor